ncbi:molybdenum cofactor biosynthesis protein MoaE [Caulobacter sp. SLTY]|uniref:molybdenum cofactor biosynthesis protein MoaE n=1 Tax=Caulobacter sp. SLTY TaxID=2683262 RepID=UPI0014136FE2|nr:molybdenum cofactor biosynthesis protein MoaE [Caulobacter sp. SLTY]NBB13931.1 molybdenum cofactor biosynthesis protein MoaE [Caulobacter sp. SLTY]
MSVTLQAEPFDPGALLTAFAAGRAETGAIASFTGLARAEQGTTTTLELEAYPGFTDAAIAEMVAAAVGRFGLQDALVVHRIGPIAPGEAIVFVATAAAHRRAAFEACDHLMDWLKSRAPFWKKEVGPGGARWIEPTQQDRTDAARWDGDPK